MDIVLATNSENPSFVFRDCEKFKDGSGYRVELSVKSGSFALETTFYFEEWSLQHFVTKLSEMEKTLRGTAILKPMWEKDYIEFEMEKLGHVEVTGEFSQWSPFEQKLKFGFETDQTCLVPFRDDLQRLLSM